MKFDLGCGPYEHVDCRIFTTAFRCVHHHELVSQTSGQDALDWDLRDDEGHLAANGLYYAVFRLEKDGAVETFTVKVMVLR